MSLWPWSSGFQQAPPLRQRWWGPAAGFRRSPGVGVGKAAPSLLTHWLPSGGVLRGPRVSLAWVWDGSVLDAPQHLSQEPPGLRLILRWDCHCS